MKSKSLLLLLFIGFSFALNAQSISVKSFKLLDNDLSAITHGTEVKDQNGQTCALIKVETVETGFTFDFGLMAPIKIEQHPGEIWVYVPFGVKRVTIQHSQFGVLRNYAFPMSIEKGRTYLMQLTTSKVVVSVEEEIKTAPQGALIGKFSVSPSKRVYFSQGNLQYQASSKTWRFAENQWDMVGDANKNISPSYNGWIDLFGWGTGRNPSSTGGIEVFSQFNDWGNNAISNAVGGEWRTLTDEEWSYVFNKRNTAFGVRFVKAKVNSVEGVILLPDNWNSEIYHMENANDEAASFDSNIITISQWTALENVGAVFLPAAGFRLLDNSISQVGGYGNYWSASYYNDYAAEYVHFNDGHLIATDGSYFNRFNGLSVRLVCPVEKEQARKETTQSEAPIYPVEIEDEPLEEVDQIVFHIVEEMPIFPGGYQKMEQFCESNTKYPQEAREKGIQGRVFVKFIIEADGSITNAKVMRGIGGGCDEEAVRVIMSMPKWIPGKQRGKAVRVSFALPIFFKL